MTASNAPAFNNLPDDVVIELVRMMHGSRNGVRLMMLVLLPPTMHVAWITTSSWSRSAAIIFWITCVLRVIASEAYAHHGRKRSDRADALAWRNRYFVASLAYVTSFSIFSASIVSGSYETWLLVWVVAASVSLGYGPAPYVSLCPPVGLVQVTIPFLGPMIPLAFSGSADGAWLAIFLLACIVSVLAHSRIEYARTVEALLGRSRNERLATTDMLTEFSNRRHLEAVVRQALVEGLPNLHWLGIDLDRFKSVNDVFGHEAGDLVLRTTARRIQDVVGAGAFVARIGGDEFVVLLTGERERARLVADAIAIRLADPIAVEKGTARIGASVGVTAICAHDTIDEIGRRADERMYMRKAETLRAA